MCLCVCVCVVRPSALMQTCTYLFSTAAAIGNVEILKSGICFTGILVSHKSRACFATELMRSYSFTFFYRVPHQSHAPIGSSVNSKYEKKDSQLQQYLLFFSEWSVRRMFAQRILQRSLALCGCVNLYSVCGHSVMHYPVHLSPDLTTL